MAQITLGGAPTNTVGELPSKGTLAPNFTAVNPKMEEFSLQDFKGKKVILNIFPSVDTGVCASSVREFNKAASELDNTVVVCLSMDLPFAQQRFCGAEGIENVIMGSNFKDEGAFAKSYGLQIKDGAFAGLHSRVIVIVDEEGKVSYTEQVPEVGEAPNYEAALAAVQ